MRNVGIVLGSLVGAGVLAGLITWAVLATRKENHPKIVGYSCNPETGQCFLTEDYEYLETDLEECLSECQQPRYACGDDFQCHLSNEGTSLLECEEECVDPGEGDRWSCNRNTGDCQLDAEGDFEEQESCQETCKPFGYACDADGVCRKDPESELTLEECQAVCRFSCDPAGEGCYLDPKSEMTKSECQKGCLFSCESGNCLPTFGRGQPYLDCRRDCRYKCNEQKQCVQDPSGRSLAECQKDCKGRYDCVGKDCVVNENGRYDSLDLCKQRCALPDRYSCVGKQCVVDKEGLFETLEECEESCLRYSCEGTRCVAGQQGEMTWEECDQSCDPRYLCIDYECARDPKGVPLDQCRQGCDYSRTRFSCSKGCYEDPNGIYYGIQECRSKCGSVRFDCDKKTGMCKVASPGAFADEIECAQRCQKENLYECRLGVCHAETDGDLLQEECSGCKEIPPFEKYPTKFRLKAVDPEFKIYEGVYQWTDVANCNLPVYLHTKKGYDVYYNPNSQNPSWKLYASNLAWQIKDNAPCFDIYQAGYAYSTDMKTFRHPLNRTKVLEVIPLTYSAGQARLKL